MRLQRREARGVAGALAAAVLVVGCTGGEPDEVEAAQATPEPTIETPSETAEPTDEPTVSEEPEPDPEPTIGEDEPLYAPLPELEPDPDNDVPDDIEQLILDAYADAYNTEFTAYATGELNEPGLLETHALGAFDAVAETVVALAEDGVVEYAPDTTINRVFIREYAGGVAVVRECTTLGPRTGDYDADTGVGLSFVEPGPDAREVRLELIQLPEEATPRYRVTDIAYTDREGCQ